MDFDEVLKEFNKSPKKVTNIRGLSKTDPIELISSSGSSKEVTPESSGDKEDAEMEADHASSQAKGHEYFESNDGQTNIFELAEHTAAEEETKEETKEEVDQFKLDDDDANWEEDKKGKGKKNKRGQQKQP